MRKLIPVLYGLGGFLLIAGLVAVFYAPGAVKKTPIKVNTVTNLSGQAAKLNTTTGQTETNPIKAQSITKVDSNASDGKVAVFTTSSCVVIDTGNPPACVAGSDPRLLTASTDKFASDRVTALATNKSGYLPASATDHSGLLNKWPFGSEKKTYPFWDGTAGKAFPAKYDGTKTVKGLETYVYKTTIKAAPIDIAEGIPGTYDDVKLNYIEPKTGAIINQVDDQQRFLADGTKVLDLQVAFTDKQVKANVDDADKNVSSLALITKIVPIVGIVGGILAILVGLLLTRRSTGTADPKSPAKVHAKV
jgi:hypothetical protein